MTRERLREVFWSSLFIVFIIAFVLAIIATANAHDWYPHDCCHQQDCAPVTKLEQVPAAVIAGMAGSAPSLPSLMRVTTKHGSVIVPANFQRRPSKDGQWHACIMDRRALGSGYHLICLFEPPSM